MNYSALSTAIQDYVESSETRLVAQIDTIITMAETRIYRGVDLNVARKYDDTVAVTGGNALVTLPSDCIVVRNVATYNSGTGARSLLEQKDPSFIDDYHGNRTTEGTPRYYAHYTDTQILIAPTTTANSVLSVAYTYRPAQISSGTTTTWLGNNAPDVLLYACLLETARFLMQEADIIKMYEDLYAQSIQGLIVEENYRNRIDEYRNGEIRVSMGGGQ